MLLVVDSQSPGEELPELLQQTEGQPRLLLLNKIDAASPARLEETARLCGELAPDTQQIPLSAASGEGLPELRAAILEAVSLSADQEQASPLVINGRHSQELRLARETLLAAEATIRSGLPLDLAGVDLEEAAWHLGQISGSQAGDGLLDAIFSRFCLGK